MYTQARGASQREARKPALRDGQKTPEGTLGNGEAIASKNKNPAGTQFALAFSRSYDKADETSNQPWSKSRGENLGK